MANSSPYRVGVIRIMQFAATMAIVLWTAAGYPQSEDQATFTPYIHQQLEARPGPAKVTGEQESALISKGYVEIGTVKAVHPGKKAKVKQQLESAILQKAAEAGGDVVRFSKDGALETTRVGTGKYSYECTKSHQFTSGSAVPGCVMCAPVYTITTVCDQREKTERMETLEGLVSEGTVWRYDPKLAADIARAEEAARIARAAQAAREAARKEEGKKTVAPLHERLEHGQDAEAELLLAQGADANGSDKDDQTHLHYVAIHGTRAEAELLLAHGADVNAKDDVGRTPLYEAVFLGHRDLAELFLAHGANVDARFGGNTPLYEAAIAGHPDVVGLLLAHGADVNAKNNHGFTALHWTKSTKIAELLLAHGANVNAKDNDGMTPLERARLHNHQDVVDLLRRHGGDD